MLSAPICYTQLIVQIAPRNTNQKMIQPRKKQARMCAVEGEVQQIQIVTSSIASYNTYIGRHAQ